MLTPAEIEQLLLDCGAILDGHFLLASGRHSARYVEKFRVLERPDLTSRLLAQLAPRFAGDRIDCVAGPVTGGIILAFEMARQLGCRSVYAERGPEGKGFVLRRGFRIQPGERVLVMEDIVTTGGSVRQVVELIRACGGEVVAVGLLVDRSMGQGDFGCERVEALLQLDIPSWAPDAVPPEIEAQYGPAVKPGSSAI